MKIKSIFKKLAVVLAVLTLVAAAAVAVMAADEYKPAAVGVSTAGEVRLDFKYTNVGTATSAEVVISGDEGSTATVDIEPEDKYGYVVSAYLAPSQMTADVTVTLKNGDITVGTPVTYSVQDYAKANAAEAVKMKALLNWGAMAQGLHEINVNDLANAGMFANGTNAVNSVSEIPHKASVMTPNDGEDTTKLSGTTNVTAFGYGASLAPTGITFDLYFNSTVAPDSVTIEREGMTATDVMPEASTGDYNYVVHINNIGAKLWNEQYTLTVVAGGETATYTTNMLNYLNALLANDSFADSHDTAKAMYLYYGLATGEVTQDSCEHRIGTHSVIADEYTTYNECSACYNTFTTQKIFNDVNYCSSPDSMYISYNSAAANPGYQGRTLQTKDGIYYLSTTASSSSVGNTYFADQATVKVGQYIVIKYRSTQNSGALRLDVTIGDVKTNFWVKKGTAITAEGWQIAVVDMSAHGNATAIGTTTVFTAITGNQYTSFDFAYFAVVDSVEEAQLLMNDGDVYKVYSNYALNGSNYEAANVEDKTYVCAHTVVAEAAEKASTCTEDGHTAGTYCVICGTPVSGHETIPALGHNIVNGVCTRGDHTCSEDSYFVSGNTYAWGCADCGHSKFSQTVSSDINFYGSIAYMFWNGNKAGKVVPTVAYDATNNVPYINTNITGSDTAGNTYLTKNSDGTNPSIKVGQYFVIKYRSSGNGGALRLDTTIGSTKNNLWVKNGTATIAEGWQIAVVDLTSHTGWTGSETAQAFTVITGNQYHGFDFAYTANVDTLAEAESLMNVGESYTVYSGYALNGSNYEAATTEVKTVACTEHISVTGDAKEPTCTEDGYTAGTYCSRCGEALGGHETVPALGHNIVDGACTRCDHVCENSYIVSSNTYSWGCTECGTNLFSQTVSSDINFYGSIAYMFWNGNKAGKVVPAVKYDSESGVPYIETYLETSTSTSEKDSAGSTYITKNSDGSNPSIKVGQYLVVKYRSEQDSAAFRLDTTIGSTKNNLWVKKGNASTADGWQIAVIDLTSHTGWTGSETAQAFTVVTGNQYNRFRFAYSANVDTLAEAESLMNEGETYTVYSGYALNGSNYEAASSQAYAKGDNAQ